MTFSKKSNFKDFDPFYEVYLEIETYLIERRKASLKNFSSEPHSPLFLVRATFKSFFSDVPRMFWLSCLCSRSFSWLLPSLRIWFLAQNWNILQMLCTQRKYWFVKSVVCRNTIDKIFKKIIKFLRTLFLNVWTMGVVSNVILYLNVRLNKEVVY